jgi:hypothetical protein
MEITPQLLSSLHLRRVIRPGQGDISLDAGMIRLLVAIDEKKTVAQTAAELKLELTALAPALARLLQLGLVEPVTKAPAYLDSRFFTALNTQIIRAVGPIGAVLIEDALGDLGLTMNTVPVRQAAELVALLANEIPDPGRRVQFQKAMLPLIPSA